MPVVVCVAGDVLLDVIVATEGPLREDDDTPARIGLAAGGQAANVATWVRHLGGRARLFGPRSLDTVGQMIDAQLQQRGVDLRGAPRDARSGAVVSLTSQGVRTLASDPGDLGWIGVGLADPAWLRGADWLHLSGYLLLRAPDPSLLVAVARAAHTAGVRVSIDLASAAMVGTYGPARFRAVVQELQPEAVLGNEAEWSVVDLDPAALPGRGCAAVVKRGPRGAGFFSSAGREELPAVAGELVDVTGAGDALAAGYLVEGPERGMRAAAECIATTGAQPPL